MASTYTAKGRLNPNKPVDVLERDERGNLVGAWHGYYNPRRGMVALYPDRKNRFAHWPGGIVPDKPRKVSDRLVRCEVPRATTVQQAKSCYVESQTRKIKNLPIEGQERMKF